MFPVPNYKWKCSACGEELSAHQDDEFPQLGIAPPKCPKCNGIMLGSPTVHSGPFPKNPFRKD